jgi:hypothetical protein
LALQIAIIKQAACSSKDQGGEKWRSGMTLPMRQMSALDKKWLVLAKGWLGMVPQDLRTPNGNI